MPPQHPEPGTHPDELCCSRVCQTARGDHALAHARLWCSEAQRCASCDHPHGVSRAQFPLWHLHRSHAKPGGRTQGGRVGGLPGGEEDCGGSCLFEHTSLAHTSLAHTSLAHRSLAHTSLACVHCCVAVTQPKHTRCLHRHGHRQPSRTVACAALSRAPLHGTHTLSLARTLILPGRVL